ncbi:hypothetical protein [Leucobacter tenebrionis]|uniref:hypothetical protein n=1 Tax=Leucobacter tenebrionis TaxID=2873270 RepID=UPI001CA74BE9|nr:hypothetical protein [Leucobacter tenebrionis]QZY52276.1 hypothetical protein KVY00_02045 [Leucobacter tenebrionis]
MSKNEHQPAAWQRFREHVDAHRISRGYQTAYDFQARWRFASSFSAVEATGYSPTGDTVEGYFALLKILLACTAREQLASLLGTDYKKLSIVDPGLAARTRKHLYGDGSTKFAEALRKPEMSGAYRHLVPYWKGEEDDVQKLVFTIRHGVAHGALTPSGLALKGSETNKRLLLDLADAVLADSDELFTAWVDEETDRRTGTPTP